MSGDVSPEGAQILTELDAVGNAFDSSSLKAMASYSVGALALAEDRPELAGKLGGKIRSATEAAEAAGEGAGAAFAAGNCVLTIVGGEVVHAT